MDTNSVMMSNTVTAPSKMMLLFLFVLGFIGSGSGFDNYDDEYYDADAEPLSFLARPQTFTVEVGQSVIIPCDVDNIGHHKLVVKKRGPDNVEQLLWVGREKMARSRRLTMDLKAKRLTITHVRRQDAGTYVCHFDTAPPTELNHLLVVQYAPKVIPTVPTEHQVKAGDKVVLACKAEGNPKPIIRWSRHEGHLPNGQSQQEGDILHLDEVDRHSEGTYLCTADNGIGPPASARMTVIVEYSPEISPEKEIIRTGEGDRVLLVCLVHGRPVPRVVWTHNGNPVKPEIGVEVNTPASTQTGSYQRSSDAHSNELNTAHRHMLKLNHVTEEDFGSYVCIAENIYGETTAAIQITGLPKPPQVISSPHAGKVHSYSLMWQTESYYPITELMVKYRKTETNPNTVVPIEWETVSEMIEFPKTSENKLHTLTYELGNLEVAQDYMATVRVRNKYGWSAESQPFDFSTQKGRQMAVQQTTSSRATRWSWNFTCFWAALLYFLICIWLKQTT